MPNRKKRAQRRSGGAGALLPALIILFALVALALILVLVYSGPVDAENNDRLPYRYSGALVFGGSGESTSAPLVLGGVATPAPTQTVAAAETSTPAPAKETPASEDAATTDPDEAGEEEIPAAEDEPNRLIPTPHPGDYFLPVFDRALRTPDDRAMIAITVDGCNDVNNMTQILRIAEQYNAELTLFPSGDALMKLSSGFRTCVNNLGYELENCSYDISKKDYSLASGELCLQLWRQSIATSYAMNRDYQQHFYRPRMQQSANDQRTHFLLRKLGFLGVAGYTYSYKGNDLDTLVKSLENGNIYQFDMSSESMALFESFLEAANQKGYKMVTMNELFEIEDNAMSNQLTISQQTLPDINDYSPTYYDLKLNDRANAVYTLQARLMGLGYLTAKPGEKLIADGIYGAETSVAVSAFQAKVGIIATGNADVATQEKLFAQDAPLANS